MKEKLNEWFVDAPWGKIAVISWGNPNGEHVLLVHGRQDSVATFIPLLELLPDHFYYVGFDLPGHGKSDPFPIGVALSRFHFVSPIDIVVKHLQWHSFVYMSHSMGGELGIYYNAAFPNAIKKFIHFDVGLALVNISSKDLPSSYLPYEDYYENYEKYNVDNRIYTRQQARESVMNARGVNQEQADLILSRNLRPLPTTNTTDGEELPGDEKKYMLSWDKRLKNLNYLYLPYEHHLYLLTTNIPPTLFIAATKSIYRYKSSNADRLIEEMQKRIQHFVYKVVEGSHDVHLTNPERVADDVISFLNLKTKSKSKL